MESSGNIKKTLKKEMKGLPEHFVILVTSSPEKSSATVCSVVDFMLNKKKLQGVYLTMNKPYEVLTAVLNKNKIDTDKLFFVDAISGIIGQRNTDAKNCVITAGPSALTELGITLSKLCDRPQLRFLVVDSLSTMLVYNSRETTVKFIQALASHIKTCKKSGIILSTESILDEKDLGVIASFCDKVVRVK